MDSLDKNKVPNTHITARDIWSHDEDIRDIQSTVHSDTQNTSCMIS